MLSYTSLTLAKLKQPKTQESFDPIFHTMQTLANFRLFGASTRRLGRVEIGSASAWRGDDVCIFLFFLFSFPYVSFSFFFLCLFLSSCNESDISFVPLKPCRRRELLLLKKH